MRASRPARGCCMVALAPASCIGLCDRFPGCADQRATPIASDTEGGVPCSLSGAFGIHCVPIEPLRGTTGGDWGFRRRRPRLPIVCQSTEVWRAWLGLALPPILQVLHCEQGCMLACHDVCRQPQLQRPSHLASSAWKHRSFGSALRPHTAASIEQPTHLSPPPYQRTYHIKQVTALNPTDLSPPEVCVFTSV